MDEVDDLRQVPGVPSESPVMHLLEEIHALYKEARRCMSLNAYTSAVMAARELLMHIAVEKGAAEGASFSDYVDHLDEKGYIPPCRAVVEVRLRVPRSDGTAITHLDHDGMVR
jgi:hypothetical protein